MAMLIGVLKAAACFIAEQQDFSIELLA